ncbi:MAG TPA: ABC transporter permease [Silvibacterium sp.]|nr:ABC transporter permease [Silvibacterium sp.]
MSLLKRLWALKKRAQMDLEIDEELRSHLEMRTADNMAEGMTPDNARREARLRFGNPVAVKEKVHAVDAALAIESVFADIRYAFRGCVKKPGFTAVAILTLALGIGANTAIFSVVHAVLLEPLPFRDPGRLVHIWHVPPQSSFPGMTRFAVSAANFLDWQKQNHAFTEMALASGGAYEITGKGKPETLIASTVTQDFFSILGVQPLYGRVFVPEEDRPGRNKEIILSYKLWQSSFGSDPNAVGRTITLDGALYIIVGVMGPKMTKPDFAQAWIPLGLTAEEAAVRGEHHYFAIARLKPGITIAQAQTEMNAISHRLEQAYPADDKGWGATVISMRDELVGDVRPALLMMLGAVGFVLLIACANVANLIFARSFSRRKEVAIRSALGAGRRRLVQLVLTESLIIAVCGGALGLVFAHFGIDLLLKFFADKLPRMGEIGLSSPVLWFTLGLSLLTGVLSGLLPALSMIRGDVNESLKQGLGHLDTDTSGSFTLSALVSVEVALSIVLLIGAGLMLRSLWNLQAVNPGFDSHNALTLALKVTRHQFTTPTQESQFLGQVLERVRALPGVEAAGAVDDLPLGGGSNQPVAVEGRPDVPMSDQPEVSVRVITPGYFKGMRIPLLEGRDLEESDTADSAAVVVISQAMAKQFWPNANPVGHHLKLTFFPDRERTVVGVVGDVKQEGLDSTAGIATLYWPAAQVGNSSTGPWRPVGMSMVVRTTNAPQALATPVTNAVAQVNNQISVDNVITLDDLIGSTLTQRSFNMQLLAIFGLLALILCTIGIYSVLAYSVKRQMREIGLRLAFGASLRDISSFVIMQGMKPTLVGIGIGLIAAFALGRVASVVIYGVSSRDFTTFVSATVLIVLVSFAASLIPALRATRVDPLTVLREE